MHSPLLSLKRPSDARIRAFLDAQRDLPFSYPETGQSEGGSPAGYDIDHSRIRIGHGAALFDNACHAIRHWRMFPAPWTMVLPPDSPLTPGTTVATTIRAFGLWWVNGARIVYTIDEPGPPRRFGFAYGTLPSHVERGEERFTVEHHPDDSVWYDIRAFSQPRYWATRLGYPVVRRLQRRFVRHSLATMAALASGSQQPK